MPPTLQVLTCPPGWRAAMLAQHALAINAKRQEVLIGLSFEESQRLLDLALVPGDPDGQGALRQLLLMLLLKYERARLRLAGAQLHYVPSRA